MDSRLRFLRKMENETRLLSFEALTSLVFNFEKQKTGYKIAFTLKRKRKKKRKKKKGKKKKEKRRKGKDCVYFGGGGGGGGG